MSSGLSSRSTKTHKIGPLTTDQSIASGSGDEQGNIVFSVPHWAPPDTMPNHRSEGESSKAPARNDPTSDPFGATLFDEDEEENIYEEIDQSPTSAPAANEDVERPQTPRGRLDSLRRELRAIHIFMIAINSVVGIGYYVKTGIILRIGGQGAVVYSYLFLGLLTLMIIRNLTVMLRVWPITGALAVFVGEFVDKEIGRVMSLLYWYEFLVWSQAVALTRGT
ncbi:unnamed protein product [Clonostachys chloroleuca]|uniref:Amino acid permease/ SLC12A domain-containing protein n=1 Tax=Clonostachys chloroleuca TaxID=1926264 RepID=A0AA35MCB9_9HYPO|nr:unnamed protein product [Clonostachys chloroleuca]